MNLIHISLKLFTLAFIVDQAKGTPGPPVRLTQAQPLIQDEYTPAELREKAQDHRDFACKVRDKQSSDINSILPNHLKFDRKAYNDSRISFLIAEGIHKHPSVRTEGSKERLEEAKQRHAPHLEAHTKANAWFEERIKWNMAEEKRLLALAKEREGIKYRASKKLSGPRMEAEINRTVPH